MAPLTKIVIDEIKFACKKQPTACGYRSSENSKFANRLSNAILFNVKIKYTEFNRNLKCLMWLLIACYRDSQPHFGVMQLTKSFLCSYRWILFLASWIHSSCVHLWLDLSLGFLTFNLLTKMFVFILFSCFQHWPSWLHPSIDDIDGPIWLKVLFALQF